MSESFLGRWSRRKQSAPEQVEAEDARLERERIAQEPATPNPPAQVAGATPGGEPSHAPGDQGAAPLNLPSLESLTPQADFTVFMKPEVPAQLKNAALKKLFTDPHFNVMDGLDTYIDDYTREDPIPEAMLRSLVQSRTLKLFDYSKEEAEEAAEKLARQQAEQGGGPDAAAATSAPVAALPEAGLAAPLAAREPDATDASVVSLPDPDGASHQ